MLRYISSKMAVCFVLALGASICPVQAENMTDVSLKWKDSAKQEAEIRSESGDLFTKVAHHGPAVENEWMGVRIYFDKKCAIDVYNKQRVGLELAEASWYPTEEQQADGWGADQYKAGTTLGLGGVRLWDGEKVVPLDPVTKRTARVRKEADFSQIEMLSEGVPYKGGTVDVLIRVTAYSGFRDMRVEAFALGDEPVEFVTGINYWDTSTIYEGNNFIATWGIHPEDVAAFQMEIGGAILFNPEDFSQTIKTDSEFLLVARPGRTLSTWIASGCEKEEMFSKGDDFRRYAKGGLSRLKAGQGSAGWNARHVAKRSGPVSNDERVAGLAVADNFLAREHRFYNGKGLHYADVCTAVGALRLAEALDDTELIDRIVESYDGLLDPEETNPMITRKPHVDHSVMGSLPLEIYLATGDERYKQLGLSFADRQWEKTGADGLTAEARWWIDDMYMVGMLQMQAFRVTGDKRYVDHAASLILAYNKKLQQPSGLFHHGPEHPFCWGRGNGWVASSMAEVLRDLPEDYPLRRQLIVDYKKMMAALLKTQTENGMWRQVVDYEYSWAESSCTAMFAYAMTVGVDCGLLDGETYGPAVEKAWKALCAHVGPHGNLSEICVGTSRENYLEYYMKRPRTLGDLHGQAPFLWLAAERLSGEK